MTAPSPHAHRTRAPGELFSGALLACAALALAQFPVQNRVNSRVNPELYGGGTGGSMRYAMAQTQVLPSEARYAARRSGALPSELRMNYLATGPLAPSGSIAYIPRQSPLQESMRLPAPQLYNPAYRITGEVTGQKPLASGPIRRQLPNGTIHYNRTEPLGSAEMPTGPAPWTHTISPGPLAPVTPPTPQPPEINRPPAQAPAESPSDSFYLSRLTPGSIHYATPTTQPAPK